MLRRPAGVRVVAALITDLKRRGLLDDTLVVWGGEFGRTVYCQGKLTAEDYGRDHHQLSVKYQGLDMRLTGIEPARVVKDILV